MDVLDSDEAVTALGPQEGLAGLYGVGAAAAVAPAAAVVAPTLKLTLKLSVPSANEGKDDEDEGEDDEDEEDDEDDDDDLYEDDHHHHQQQQQPADASPVPRLTLSTKKRPEPEALPPPPLAAAAVAIPSPALIEAANAKKKTSGLKLRLGPAPKHYATTYGSVQSEDAGGTVGVYGTRGKRLSAAFLSGAADAPVGAGIGAGAGVGVVVPSAFESAAGSFEDLEGDEAFRISEHMQVVCWCDGVVIEPSANNQSESHFSNSNPNPPYPPSTTFYRTPTMTT